MAFCFILWNKWHFVSYCETKWRFFLAIKCDIMLFCITLVRKRIRNDFTLLKRVLKLLRNVALCWTKGFYETYLVFWKSVVDVKVPNISKWSLGKSVRKTKIASPSKVGAKNCIWWYTWCVATLTYALLWDSETSALSLHMKLLVADERTVW